MIDSFCTAIRHAFPSYVGGYSVADSGKLLTIFIYIYNTYILQFCLPFSLRWSWNLANVWDMTIKHPQISTLTPESTVSLNLHEDT